MVRLVSAESIEDFNQSISNLPQPQGRIRRKSQQGWHAAAAASLRL